MSEAQRLRWQNRREAGLPNPKRGPDKKPRKEYVRAKSWGKHSDEAKAKLSVAKKLWWLDLRAEGKPDPRWPKGAYVSLAGLRAKRSHTPDTIERMSKARKAWWREKRRKDRRSFDWESGVKGKDRGVNQYARMKYPLAGWKMMACRMGPGRAYTRSEVYRLLPDAPINSASPWLSQGLVGGGFVEKVLNPDYQGRVVDAFGWHRGMENPRWLYRLTEGGRVARRLWVEEMNAKERGNDDGGKGSDDEG
jgi:hypothetical protein